MCNIVADKKNKPEKIVLKKDFVIPAGTTFECIDGMKREYASGNYEAIIGTSKDTTMNVVVCEDELNTLHGWFEDADYPKIKEKIFTEKMAKWIRNKLARRGLNAARIDESELVYIFHLETEYMKENGIVED